MLDKERIREEGMTTDDVLDVETEQPQETVEWVPEWDDSPEARPGENTRIEDETLITEFIEYEEGDGDMPDQCPVCGEDVVQIEELDAGESYAVDRFCVEEKTAGGPGHGIIHWKNEGSA